jgi:hypothetical protein
LTRAALQQFAPYAGEMGHVGPDGMNGDPFFNIDLYNLPTGPARGHDMLLN